MSRKQRQHSRDGIHYEVLKKSVTASQWKVMRARIDVMGWKAHLESVSVGMPLNQDTIDHMKGAFREIGRVEKVWMAMNAMNDDGSGTPKQIAKAANMDEVIALRILDALTGEGRIEQVRDDKGVLINKWRIKQ